MRIRCVFTLLALLGAGFASQAVHATLVGTVTDSTGAVVPNVKVTITEAQTNVARLTATK